jgi:baseplate J-like protein
VRTQLHCPEDARREAVRDKVTINGIDHLEVLASQRTLLVHCFRSVDGLDADNVLIDGGERVTGVQVEWATAADVLDLAVLRPDERARIPAQQPARKRILVVRTDRAGDFSAYRLELVESRALRDRPPADFDPIRSGVNFSFKVDCDSGFDCADDDRCEEPEPVVPQIDYLAKDYASFRRLLLDRLSIVTPDWRERNPSDVLVALVELIAYAGDQLSYHQDAAATEAYLGTARRRESVRRHARLVDYRMHDGANARTWVVFEIEPDPETDLSTLDAGTMVLTGEIGEPSTLQVRDVPAAASAGALVFETLESIVLREARNEIAIHTWADPDCCLPAGATRATLRGDEAALRLRAGEVLLFEEVRGAGSGRIEDRDPAHQHAVRLVADPVRVDDPLETAQDVLEIEWHPDDALPFPLCLRLWGDNPTAVARGNVALCDHGQRISAEELGSLPRAGRRFRPLLARPGLTHAWPYDAERARQLRRPAREALRLDLDEVRPWAFLRGEGELWEAERELLGSDRFATKFVVEMTGDGRAQLRFGDDVIGREPQPGTSFTATYRVGNGRAGNVGAGALKRVAVDKPLKIRSVRNPIPASGGTDPESLEQTRLFAPQAFRSQRRAVTVEDYARAAETHPEVQRAGATRRWTGSWWTMFVTVDRIAGRPIDRPFEADLRRHLDALRMAGHDIEIDGPAYVSLELGLDVCVAPGYVRADVKEALLEELSNRRLSGGRLGFFHPDLLTFGQTVYLSPIVARVMQVPGVEWVEVTAMHRFGELQGNELERGRIDFGKLEIARLDNDPNRPENGRLDISMRGGA